MAYALHIEGFEPDELAPALAGIPTLRLETGPTEFKNPRTGAVVSIGGVGRIEVLSEGEWVPGLMVGPEGDSLSIAARGWNPEDPNDPIASAVHDLAEMLGCPIVGDEGEEYPRPKAR